MLPAQGAMARLAGPGGTEHMPAAQSVPALWPHRAELFERKTELALSAEAH
jgi:hypothetical protein